MLSRSNFLFVATLLFVLVVTIVLSVNATPTNANKNNNNNLRQQRHPFTFHKKNIRNSKQRSFSSSASQLDPSFIFEQSNFSGAVTFTWPSPNPATANSTTFWKKNFGFLDEQFKIPLPENPSYPIASNTKLYIAVSLYQLHERSAIKSMDDSIADYLGPADFQAMGVPQITKYCPKLAADPNATGCQIVTFRQLLGMSSGLTNLGLQWMPFPGSLALVAGWHIQAPLQFPPGSPSPQNANFRNYYYSNAGFELSAYFVEKLSGMNLNDFLTKNIYSVVGLTHTYFDPYNGKFQLDPERVNEFYKFIDQNDQTSLLGLGKASSEFDLGSASGAGGIVSKQPDEERLFRFLFSNFSASAPVNALLSHESIMAIVTPYAYIAQDFFYGQGMFVTAPEEPSQQPTNFGNGRIPRTNPPVTVIQYEGEIMASHTANYFMLEYDPPVMAQVWSSVIVFYPTVEQYTQAQVLRNENFFQVTGSFQQQTGLGQLAAELIQFLMGDPQK